MNNNIKVASLDNYSIKQLLRCVIPTLIGCALFLIPIPKGDSGTILIAYLIDYLNDVVKPLMLPVVLGFTLVPTLLTLLVSLSSLIKSTKNSTNRFMQLLNPGLGWTIVRTIGSILMLMVYFEVGPEWIWHRNTGGVMLYDIAPVVLVMYFLSAILLPLLTDYGLMEFVGTLVSRPFQWLFRLPGRAAVDCLASWLSAASIGVILTTQQYRQGFYNAREACVITTNFSIISIAYAYLLIKLIGLQDMFIPWYGAVAATGIICALIVPRLPPLRGKSQEYFPATGKNMESDRRPGEGLFELALRRAITRSDKAPSVKEQVRHGTYISLDIIISVYPAMMLVGCFGLALVEFTSFFQILSLPLVPYLQLLQLPEAELAAPALLAGFIDSIMPPILGAKIESEVTRFVLSGVAVTQIIYLTEIAIILLRANIGFRVIDILWIYILRVMIALPIMSLFGHLLLG